MSAPRRFFWGIGFKIVMFFGIPAGLTLLLLWGVFIPLVQRIMFDHEMTDLADETELRGYELADQTQSQVSEFLSLARLIEEGNMEGWQALCRSAEHRYLLIETIETEEVDGEFNLLPVDRDYRFGTSIDPEGNASYRYFRDSLLQEIRVDRLTEQIETRLSKARIAIRSREYPERTEEAHVFWVGGQIIPATADRHGKILVMGLGLDERFARMSSTPRHMTVVVDDEGKLVLNPFSQTLVADEAGNFIRPAGTIEEPFENAHWVTTLAQYAREQVDWEEGHLQSILLPFRNEPWYSQNGLRLPQGRRYYYWESADVGFSLDEVEISMPAIRRIGLALADREWRAAERREDEEFSLRRMGGLSTTVSSLRLLASDESELEMLRDQAVKVLREEFQHTLPAESRQRVFEKLQRLATERIVPVECFSARVSTISVPLSSTPHVNPTGVVISRVIFAEEVKAALGERLNEATLYSTLMIGLVFGGVLLSGLKIASLLRRMSRSAEAFSSLTFDHDADAERWQRQAEELSATLPTDRKDELGVLAQSFQRLIRDVLSSQLALRDLNRELELRVERRTEELRSANEELMRGRDEARRLARSKDEFLASVSHELRTPLNWLYGAVQFLEMAELDEQQATDVRTIRKATEDLRDLIEDILDYQKIVMDGMSIEISEFEVVPLLEDIAQSLRMYADKHGSSLDVEWDDGLGTIRTDARRLKQIVKNLGTNACKFKDPNGVRPNQVRISARRAPSGGGGEILIRVSDTGRGMRPEEQKKLFHRFERLSSNVEGTGLGLVITRGLVELLRGRIEFETEFGTGTTVTVRIPVAESALPPNEPVVKRLGSAASLGGGASDSSGAIPVLGREPSAAVPLEMSRSRKILVVDDDENVVEMMSRFLGEHGFEVATATDGVSALRQVRQDRPDLIALDVVMPDLDGWTVLAALKADEQTASIPVVMTTTMDDKEKGFALGADDYLLKPIDWNHLKRVLDRYCGAEAKQSILIVDDDLETRRLLRRQLEQDGWSVGEAEHGQQALERLRDDPPQLILLDLMMPVMNGFEFLLAREEQPEWRTIPVIVLTARDPGSADVEQLQGSVARILCKGSYTHDELLAEIRRRLGDSSLVPRGDS
jgi:CheY-like chemotaxis protein